MGVARLQMTWGRDNGLTEDYVTNTWHFKDGTGPLDSAEANSLCDALNVFYNNLSTIYAAYMSTSRTIKAFDLEEPEPRVPVHTETYVPTAPANEGIPAQLAVALSFYRQASSGQNPRRMRGRIYLGPLAAGAMDAGGGTGDRRINSAAIATINSAYDTLITSLAGIGGGWLHSVYSPTTDGAETTFDSTFPVTNAYVDNQFDVIRSRASRTTSRTAVYP